MTRRRVAPVSLLLQPPSGPRETKRSGQRGGRGRLLDRGTATRSGSRRPRRVKRKTRRAAIAGGAVLTAIGAASIAVAVAAKAGVGPAKM